VVKGLVHMCVFMAGATRSGFWKSQARTMHVRRLSQTPAASLARVLAERGAITRTSAQFRSSMWSTVSPSLLHFLHSSSVRVQGHVHGEGGRLDEVKGGGGAHRPHLRPLADALHDDRKLNCSDAAAGCQKNPGLSCQS